MCLGLKRRASRCEQLLASLGRSEVLTPNERGGCSSIAICGWIRSKIGFDMDYTLALYNQPSARSAVGVVYARKNDRAAGLSGSAAAAFRMTPDAQFVAWWWIVSAAMSSRWIATATSGGRITGHGLCPRPSGETVSRAASADFVDALRLY